MWRKQSDIALLFISVIAVLLSIATILSQVKLPVEYALNLSAGLLGTVLAILLSAFMMRHLIPPKPARIFISYCSSDQTLAKKLANDLRLDGYEVLSLEDTVSVGETITSTLLRALEHADFLVLILSENSLKSESLRAEIKTAIECKIRVFPVVLGDIEIPHQLKDIRYVKLGESYSDTYRILEKSIRNFLPERKKTAPRLS